MYAENYLMHYGVIGMHWGQRKAQMNAKIVKIKKHERFTVGSQF